MWLVCTQCYVVCNITSEYVVWVHQHAVVELMVGEMCLYFHIVIKAPTELALKIAIASPEDTTLQAQYHLYSVAGKKSFTYLAPHCWNALPRHLRVLTDLEQFKASIKHYLFTNFNEYKHNVDPYTTTVIL